MMILYLTLKPIHIFQETEIDRFPITNSTAEVVTIGIMRRKNGIPMFCYKTILVIHNTVIPKYFLFIESSVIVCIDSMSLRPHTYKAKEMIEKKYKNKYKNKNKNGNKNKKVLRKDVTNEACKDFDGEMKQMCVRVYRLHCQRAGKPTREYLH